MLYEIFFNFVPKFKKIIEEDPHENCSRVLSRNTFSIFADDHCSIESPRHVLTAQPNAFSTNLIFRVETLSESLHIQFWRQLGHVA